MDLISRIANEPDNAKTLSLLREATAEDLRRIQGQLGYIQPGQGGQIISILFEALVLAEHRTKDEKLLKKAKKALNDLINAISPLLVMDDCPVDPDQVGRLYSLCASCEFTVAARHAVERRHQEEIEAAEHGGVIDKE